VVCESAIRTVRLCDSSPVKEALTVLNGDAKEQVLEQQGVRINDYTERMNAARNHKNE